MYDQLYNILKKVNFLEIGDILRVVARSWEWEDGREEGVVKLRIPNIGTIPESWYCDGFMNLQVIKCTEFNSHV